MNEAKTSELLAAISRLEALLTDVKAVTRATRSTEYQQFTISLKQAGGSERL